MGTEHEVGLSCLRCSVPRPPHQNRRHVECSINPPSPISLFAKSVRSTALRRKTEQLRFPKPIPPQGGTTNGFSLSQSERGFVVRDLERLPVSETSGHHDGVLLGRLAVHPRHLNHLALHRHGPRWTVEVNGWKFSTWRILLAERRRAWGQSKIRLGCYSPHAYSMHTLSPCIPSPCIPSPCITFGYRFACSLQ